MLVFMLSGSKDDIDIKIRSILYDFSNNLYASSMAANELISLYKNGKIRLVGFKTAQDVLTRLEDTGIELVFFNRHHMSKYLALDLVPDHKDMNDHAIIAQAISDRIPLISSDRKFSRYESQGLQFVFNKR
jgi:PIN domain nuclease of toxin-antitoxin system